MKRISLVLIYALLFVTSLFADDSFPFGDENTIFTGFKSENLNIFGITLDMREEEIFEYYDDFIKSETNFSNKRYAIPAEKFLNKEYRHLLDRKSHASMYFTFDDEKNLKYFRFEYISPNEEATDELGKEILWDLFKNFGSPYIVSRHLGNHLSWADEETEICFNLPDYTDEWKYLSITMEEV